MSNKGKAGSVRVNPVDRGGLPAMQKHELREDYTGERRAQAGGEAGQARLRAVSD